MPSPESQPSLIPALEEEVEIKTEAKKLDKIISPETINDPVGAFLTKLGQDPNLAGVEKSAANLSYLSAEQKAESMWATFQALKGITTGRKEKDWARAKIGLSLLKELYDEPETRKVYQAANAKHLQEVENINGDYEKYEALKKHITEAEKAVDASASNMFSHRGAGVDEIDILILENNKRDLAEQHKELAKVVSENPELGALAQYEAVRTYADQLKREGFIWSPSRRVLLEQIEEAALSGRPVLLSGESGTGKTRLVEQAALTLTGRTNAQTAGKNVRFQDLIAKQKISDGVTYYEYKEVGEAVTGKKSTLQDKPEHGGLIIADDEFNLRPTAEQSEMLARIATWTPGKKVRLPVTNEEVTIAPDFLYCAMVNLASERYDRQRIPPEVLRKFAKVDVDYPEQNSANPELYEMMLAALMDENGRLQVAKSELAPYYEEREEVDSVIKNGQSIKRTVRIRELKEEVAEGRKTVPAGGFLWRFAGAMQQLNNSFSRRETVLKAKGEDQYLQDLVIDTGTILSWLKEYGTLGRHQALETFMIDKLNTEFLSKNAYRAEDRQLAKEFMKHFGIEAERKSPSDKSTV